MTLRDGWWFLSGSAATWALACLASRSADALDVAVFAGLATLFALVPLRGWWGSAAQPVEDATASFRRARKAARRETR